MTLRLLTFFVGVFTAALTFAALAVAAPIENSTIPLSFETDASCTGESIAFEGSLHLVRQRTETANGWHVQGHVNEHLVGVGLLSGARYVGTISGSVNVNVATPLRESSNATLVSTVHIVRVGEPAQSDDYSEHIIVRLTINANGEEKAFADEFRGGCD